MANELCPGKAEVLSETSDFQLELQRENCNLKANFEQGWQPGVAGGVQD